MMNLTQSLESYNKIGSYRISKAQRFMTDPSKELEGLRSFDPEVIAEIHNHYYADIYRFVKYRVSDNLIAEDISSDVFMHLLEAIHANKGPTKNLRGWLLRTASNVVNDYFRTKYSQPKEDSTEILEESTNIFLSTDGPDVLSDNAERGKTIRLALEKLTDAQKLVITLRFGNRFSLEDTAIIMGKNINTIKALQFRALISLRKNIGNDLL